MWATVPGFNNYEASDEGFIRNVSTGRVLKNSIHSDGTGMPCVSLVRDSKVHVLEVRFILACTFLGADIEAKPRVKVIYKDGDKFNNSISNLEIKDSTSLAGEEWRPIKELDGLYQVSNLGRVKRLAHVDHYVRSDTGNMVDRYVCDTIVKLLDHDGYYEVGLRCRDADIYRLVHRLVATEFIPNPEGLPQVNHIDGNKKNNCVTNLEWCTSEENIQHAFTTGLRGSVKGQDRSPKVIKCIETGEVFRNKREASKMLNIPYSYLVGCINTGRACHGLHFEQFAIDRRVKCLDTGDVFNSLGEVREHFGFDVADSISRRSCVHGWTFCYVRDLPDDENQYLEECRNRYSQWDRAEKRWEELSNS